MPTHDTIRFPFEHGKAYAIGRLREFERELLAARQADPVLSARWRVPDTREMVRWGKVREETYPIKLLADQKGYQDDATFFLKPFGFPGIDADMNVAAEKFSLQITVADPIWDERNGGYDKISPTLKVGQVARPS